MCVACSVPAMDVGQPEIFQWCDVHFNTLRSLLIHVLHPHLTSASLTFTNYVLCDNIFYEKDVQNQLQKFFYEHVLFC